MGSPYLGVKRYSVQDNWTELGVVLEVDHSVITIEMATEINNFWTGASARLAAADKDVVKAVIRIAARHLMWLLLEHRGAQSLAQRDFDREEGWPGTGIKLLSHEGMPELDDEDFIVTELAAEEGATSC